MNNVNGRPRVRWRRVAAAMALVAGIEFLAATVVTRFTEMPINVFGIFAPYCVYAAFMVMAVELQRQRLLYGVWRFRYSLRAVLLMTALAASFFGLVTASMRATQRSFAVNESVKHELESAMRGGNAWISMPGGRRITCQVTRTSFADDDLALLIAAASHGESGTCELSTLFLSGTSVTDAGVRQLAACRKLTFVELPSLELSDPAVDALAACRRLEFLFLDESRLTDKQIDRLHKALPKLRLNGKTWADRDGTP